MSLGPFAAAALGFGLCAVPVAVSKFQSLLVLNDWCANEAPQPKRGDETQPVRLLQMEGAPGVTAGSLSPFCLKVEALMRVGGIPHTTEVASPLKAPRKTLPVIVHGANTVHDSEAINTYLQETFGGADGTFGGRLSKPQGERAAVLRAARVLVEQQLYYGLVEERFVDEEGFRFTSQHEFLDVPSLIRPWVHKLVRKSQWQHCWNAGWARHDKATRQQMAEDNLEALDEVLGERKYFGGDLPCATDMAIFGCLEQLVDGTPGFMHKACLRRPRLVAYVERFKREYFEDVEAEDRKTV